MLENKQINHEQNSVIIDGIDVSGCIHYRNYNDEFHCDLLSEPLVCMDNPNCHYKQHKRKEKILNNIKEYAERYLGSADRYYILKMMGEI